MKDGLVARVADWPGVNGLDALVSWRTIFGCRPEKLFRASGPMPEQVELALRIPVGTRQIGDVAEFLEELRDAVAQKEAEFARQRAESGRGVVGATRVLGQSWRASPSSRGPRRGLRPRVAARSLWSRLQTLQRNRGFIDAYRKARKAWLAGIAAIFPRGTYWLRRFAHVAVEEAEVVSASINFR